VQEIVARGYRLEKGALLVAYGMDDEVIHIVQGPDIFSWMAYIMKPSSPIAKMIGWMGAWKW
jgi:hypothetical protein